MEHVLELYEVAPVYKDYEEVPFLMRQYLETVADVYDYAQIPLEEINQFLAGLYEFYKGRDVKPTPEQMEEWQELN